MPLGDQEEANKDIFTYLANGFTQIYINSFDGAKLMGVYQAPKRS